RRGMNYEVRRTAEAWGQRSGGTGSMSADGDAIRLVTPDEKKEGAAIERAVGHSIRDVKLKDFDYHKQPAHEPAHHDRGAEQHERRGGREERRAHTPPPPAAPASGRPPKADRPGPKQRRRF